MASESNLAELFGGGTCAPLFVTVTGLNDRELPSADMLLVQVAGLCIGVSDVGENEQKGYIVFTKSGQDQKRFEFYKAMSSYHSSTPSGKNILTLIPLMAYQYRMN